LNTGVDNLPATKKLKGRRQESVLPRIARINANSCRKRTQREPGVFNHGASRTGICETREKGIPK
jgi:hypothetical protein